jgi:putative transposase
MVSMLIQGRRCKTAALRLMRELLKGQCVTPRVMITDKLRS